MSWIFTSFDCCIQWNIVGFAIITQLDLPGFLLLITLLQLTTHNSGFSSMRNQLTNPFHFSERVRAQSHAGVNHGLVTKCEDYHWPTLGKTPCELGTQDPSFQGPEQLYFVHKAQIHSCEGFSLPMVACSKSREFAIMSHLALCVSSLSPFCLHSLTELGTISLRFFPRDSKSWELFPETLMITDDRVSVSFGVAFSKEFTKVQVYK